MNATPIRYTAETLAPLSPSELYKLYMDIFGIRPKSPNATYLRRQILEGQARLDAERAELAEQLLQAERQVVRGAAGGASEDELGALQAASDQRAAALEAAGGDPLPVIAQVAVEAGASPELVQAMEEWAANAPASPTDEREYSEAELAAAEADAQQAADYDLVAHGVGNGADLWVVPTSFEIHETSDEDRALQRIRWTQHFELQPVDHSVVLLGDLGEIVIDDPRAEEPVAQLPPAPADALLIISRVHEDDMIAAALGEDQPADLAAQARATVAAFLEARGVKTLGKLSVEALRELYPQAVGRDTGSTDKGYLVWKIREATKGAITLGPVQPRAAAQQAPAEPRPERQPRPPKAEAEKAPREPSRAAQRRAAGIDRPVLPLAMERPTVDALDAAWRALGFPSQIAFLRVAIAEALERGGQADAAALVRAEAG